MVAELFKRVPSGLSQPVLVLDLSQESVEAMKADVSKTIEAHINRHGEAWKTAHGVLARLGIKADKNKGKR